LFSKDSIREEFCINCTLFEASDGQGPVVSYYHAGLEFEAPVPIAQIRSSRYSVAFSKDGRLEVGIVHIDVGYQMQGWEKEGHMACAKKQGA